MFVYAIYEKYLKDGKVFIPKFKEALSLGSSVSPLEIGKVLGVDVADKSFWNLGLERFEKFLDELEALI